MNIEPGATLLHYRLLRRLGAGGFGEVFEAEDTKLGRSVAIKFLNEKAAKHPQALERLRREARALASLQHPAIVTIHAIEEVDGQLFLVMERIEGTTLRELLRKGALPADRLLPLALRVSEGMAAAHAQGIVHRDLKPGNIMIGPDGRPKILDFGLARLEAPMESEAPTVAGEPLTQAGAAVGTWDYMAPEQIQGEAADARSDVFALGSLLYEAATGVRPFVGPTAADIADAIRRYDPPSLRQLRSDLPVSFVDLVHWCLEKKPEDRPADARVVHDTLGGLLRAVERDSASTAAASRASVATAATQVTPPKRGHRIAWIAAALVAILAVAGFVWYRWFERAPQVPTAVAVLPFANLSGNPDLEHLARGIPSGLITRLAQVAGLEVLSRSETWSAAGMKLPPARLAQKLGVASLVEGELRGDEKKLEVDIRLTDASSGVVLWSQGFSGSAGDIFALQREIAVRLTRVLAVPLSAAERQRMAKDPTTSLAAYSFDLRGEQSLADATDEQGAELAVSQFREALRRDPDFALAHAGLAEALVRLHQDRPEAALLEEADREAHRALKLDPALGPAHVALARVARAQGHPESAIKELKGVVSSLAQPDEAYRDLAVAYQQMGDLDQAEDALRLAVASAPDYWLDWEKLGGLLMRKGSYDEARASYERAGALAPEGVKWPELNLATLELFLGQFQASLNAYEQAGALSLTTRSAGVASNVGTAYFYLGDLDKAAEYYRRAVDLDPDNDALRRNLGDMLLRLRKKGEAAEQYRSALALVDKRLEQTPGDRALLLSKAVYAAKVGLCPEALATADGLEKEHAAVGEDARSLAEAYALCGKSDKALAAIRAAIASGVTPKSLAPEAEFESLRSDPRFQKLVGRGSSTGPGAKAR